MLDIKQFLIAIEQLAAEKNIPKEKVLEAVEYAIAAAYKKENDLQSCKVKAKLDPDGGQTEVWQELTVVTEESLEEEEKKFNPKKQIMLEDAKKKKKSIKVGDTVVIPLKVIDDYGRIATQTAKQVIIQKIKEIERDITIGEYKTKEGDAISGIVQREEHGVVYIDIGRTNGILPPQEQVPNERYNIGQRLKFLLLSIKEDARGPVIFLSRNRSEFLKKLLEFEIPEVANGSVKIEAIAREAGKRSKVAVVSKEEGIDPIGACVGQRGTRISAVISELGGENIDIILWSENPQELISNALAPAKVLDVKIDKKENIAKVVVADDQLSLAIGKGGQNVRLAAKLTGCKIDVSSDKNQPIEIKPEEIKTDEKIEEKSKVKKSEKKSSKSKAKKDENK
ncbi:MAG: transcription termination factor NusA [Candidatus Paceibacterota bacterium]|jgi:N utilization substance protein A